MTSIRTMRTVALVEATSFLALLVASYLKHNDQGAAGVSILGPIHGVLFIAYVWLALTIRGKAGWTTPQTIWVLLGAVVPFGGYVVDWWILKHTPEPADASETS